MNKKINEDKESNKISVGRAIAFATSSVFMIISFVGVGYFIGKNWGDEGAGIGVLIGGLLGIISLLSDLGRFLKK